MKNLTPYRKPTCSWWLVVLLIGLLAVAGSVAWAQDAPPASRTYSLDFVDTELSDVVRALSVQSGANIALKLPEGTKGANTVTVQLRQVSLDNAVRVIAGLSGLAYAQLDDNTYVLGQLGDEKSPGIRNLRAANFKSKIVTLRLAQKADYISALLKEVAPEVTATPVPGSRSVVLAGPEWALQAAGECLAGVVAPDVTDAQTIVYEVKYANCGELRDSLMRLVPDLVVDLAPRTDTPYVSNKALGDASQDLLTPQTEAKETTGSTGGANTGFDQNTGVDKRPTNLAKDVSPFTCLLLTGSPATLDRAKALLAQLDVAPKLITINAMVTELRTDATDRLGIDWHGLGGETGVIVGEPVPADEASGGGSSDTFSLARDLKLGRFMRSHLAISATINALITTGKAKILSNPTITLLDGRQATIHSGEKIYYPQIVGYTPLGGQIVQATQIDTGITLAVNPRIGPDGDIVMTLVPTVSDIAPSRFAGYPTITERSVVTTVRVKAGETLVLGGLVRDEMTETTSKVPLLGDIPLIGQLFKSRTKTPRHSEVLIFITPKLGGSAPPAAAPAA